MSREHRLRHTALVLLKCFQQLHYFPELDHIPAEISQHIAQVMGLGATRAFAVSAATRYRQETAIRRYLGITPFYGTEGRRMALHAATAAAPLVTQRVDLINAIIDELLRGRVELPAYSTLVQIAEDVASEGETDLIDLIKSRLNAGQCQQMDHLLHTDLDRHRSVFDRLKRVPKRPSRDHLDTLIEHCHWLDEFGDVDGLLVGIPYLKRRYYANYALALDAGDLKDLIPAKRYTLVLTMIQHLRARVRDDLGEMFVRRMATIHQCAQEELEQFLIRQRQLTHAVAAQFDAVLPWWWRTCRMRSWATEFGDPWDPACNIGARSVRMSVPGALVIICRWSGTISVPIARYSSDWSAPSPFVPPPRITR